MIVCPKCSSDRHSVRETRDHPQGTLRYHRCHGCGASFKTLQAVVQKPLPRDAARNLYQLPGAAGDLAGLPDRVRPAKPRKAARFVATLDAIEAAMQRPVPVGPLCMGVAELLLRWWNESRMQKHGGKAVWSEAAFSGSVRRVAVLSHAAQGLLAEAGVEHGWQALKIEYLQAQPSAPTPALPALSGPRNPEMRQALESVT